MRNALLIAALTLASASAFASKARVNALQGARTTASDFQDVFEQPAKMWDLADQATFEFGTSTPGLNSPTAEGGFLRSGEDAKWGMYFGRTNASLRGMLNGIPTGNALLPTLGTGLADPNARYATNPLNVFYGAKAGDLNYGLSLYYAASQVEGFTKKSAYGLSFGAGAERWIASAVLGLGAKFEDDTANDQEEFKGDTSMKFDLEYAIDDVLLGYGTLTKFGGTHNNAAGAEQDKYDYQQIVVGVESKVKSDVAHFFYGARLDNTTAQNKTTGAKIEGLTLPVYFGLEADAASWLVLRAALTQNVLLTTAKITTGTGATAVKADSNSTTASLGAGLKFGKLMIDGSVLADTAATGDIYNNARADFGTDRLMTNMALTYVF